MQYKGLGYGLADRSIQIYEAGTGKACMPLFRAGVRP